jgi:hypothetical protein
MHETGKYLRQQHGKIFIFNVIVSRIIQFEIIIFDLKS